MNWSGFVERFLEETFAARPTIAAALGRHEHDGRLPDWSLEGLAGEVARLRRAGREAAAFPPGELGAGERFERRQLLATVEHDLFWLGQADWPRRNPFFYAEAFDPNLYLTREYAPAAARRAASARLATAIPAAVEQVRGNLEPPLPRPYSQVGEQIFRGLASFYAADVPAAFAGVGGAEAAAELAASCAGAARALSELADWVAGAAGADDGYALGEEGLAAMIRRTEGFGLPLAALREAAAAELRRNLGGLEEAAAAMGLRAPEALERVLARKSPDGPVAAARRQLAGLRSFVESADLMTVPPGPEVRVEEAPLHNRWNAAYIDIPGPYESGLPATYYIAPPDPAWTEEERRAYVPAEADLLFISAHEVWPGHWLHFLRIHRVASPLGRSVVSYAAVEGWAHYAEELIWEAGFGDGDPEVRIGQILNALLRNVRVLAAIGLHADGMSLPEAAALFRDQAFQDPGNARQQAARGTFDPAYLNYTLGKLVIRKLRRDWTAPRGGRRAWKEFHDRFLSFGGPPLPLVRDAMMGEPGELI
jgi:hypothetical protein